MSIYLSIAWDKACDHKYSKKSTVMLTPSKSLVPFSSLCKPDYCPFLFFSWTQMLLIPSYKRPRCFQGRNLCASSQTQSHRTKRRKSLVIISNYNYNQHIFSAFHFQGTVQILANEYLVSKHFELLEGLLQTMKKILYNIWLTFSPCYICKVIICYTCNLIMARHFVFEFFMVFKYCCH